jgi:hypothetical protein
VASLPRPHLLKSDHPPSRKEVAEDALVEAANVSMDRVRAVALGAARRRRLERLVVRSRDDDDVARHPGELASRERRPKLFITRSATIRTVS